MQKLIGLYFLIVVNYVSAQGIENKSFDQFYQEDISKSKGILVVNFWATWCRPCIEELPNFEKINSEMDSENFKVCLVNLDFNSQFKTLTTEFVEKRNIKSRVLHINDTNPNEWIDKVDSKWSGAIPATVIYKNGIKVYFNEGEMTYEELKSEILKLDVK